MRFSCATALAAVYLAAVAPAMAQDRTTLGQGRLFSNDVIGDGQDRWRTGSYVVSQIRGPWWNGVRPEGFGTILEYRFRADLIAPDNLVAPASGDRRYAGALSFGVHTHFARGATEMSVGLDLVATGPATRLSDLQTAVHDLAGITPPSDATLDNQIGNGLHPTLTAEAGWPIALGGASFRPFIEAQAGAETLVRVGGDLMIGGYGTDALLVRDGVTGQLYPATRGAESGLSLVIGGDVAHVADSIYIPSDGAITLSDSRTRLRAGVQWQGDRARVFYGLTWLDREFEEQPEGQVLGSIRIGLSF